MVKFKLNPSDDNQSSNLRAFESEIRALVGIQHRNIVKLYGFCFNAEYSFLIYEFVEKGSLTTVLSNPEEAADLDWDKRFNIVKGLTSALSYMHHDCPSPIIHRDISSNNVLLDLDYEAHVPNFGTARVLKPDSSNWTSFAGTVGYTAPDVLKDVIDQCLKPQRRNKVDEQVVATTKLAFTCLHSNPQFRPTMQQVYQALTSGRPSPLPKPYSMISLGDLIGDGHGMQG
ncbi:hypothetical protein SLEP1_g54444 [Rubroshorea leprosula]|uniref:non-specific serine/threonine protein kinase n=1 Tax=Rubroshorea leprosula TaxID=152421 RepID=A0AAV5MDC7_9ROSI|nr:hypothetical protein SLEP1_g54444 [Rubroshorea leprosula]